MKQPARAVCLILITLSLLTGCTSVDPPGSLARRFFDNLQRYPQNQEPLRIQPLTSDSLGWLRNSAGAPDVYIIVHPAYALYFRDEKRARYSDAKYGLLMRQFEEEERFIREAARSGKIVVLIVPGEQETQKEAPDGYTAYLNALAGGAASVFYLYSASASNGTIPISEMVELYQFLQRLKVRQVLIGGGYIGRCQREFFFELTAYFETSPSYVVPELSTISPEDISDAEATVMLQGIERKDYGLIRKFIGKKLDRTPEVLFSPRNSP